MDVLDATLRLVLLINVISPGLAACLTGCSCSNENLGRSLLCMESSMGSIPDHIPEDFTKIRIEKCHVTELRPRAFSGVGALEFLWLNFNDITVMNIRSLEGLRNLSELRLQGNKLSSVPWTAFQDTPKLKILDLKNNRLDVLPEHALRHLAGLTYLDLSFNLLSVASRDVFLNWPLYQQKSWSKEGLVSNVVLALHENPWLCDCRLKGFVEFIRSIGPPLILMNSYLMCSGPSSKANKFFHEIQIKTCTQPVVSVPEWDMMRPVGENATLRCSVKSRPRPVIQWTNHEVSRGFSATQTTIDEETFISQLFIASLRAADGGLYTCTAKNFMGNSSASITLNISTALLPPPIPIRSPEETSRIEIRIAKQTVYGITLEWYALTENPAETWFTIHFGTYDSPKKETIYIGPGINSYSVSDLLPVTKYEVCVSLRNRPPREGQCIVFVTGSDISELEQRERLIHIIVIVCAMVLAVPAGMYACTTDARFSCAERCVDLWRKSRTYGENLHVSERQGTFDSLQAASDEGLCRKSDEKTKKGPKLDNRCKGGSAAHLY